MDISEARSRLRGSIVPLVTPFTKDDQIDEQAFRRLVDWQIASGSHGVSVTGTTGEPSALSLKEREQMIVLGVEAAAGRVPVLAGSGTNNLKETLMLTRVAEREGADAALVIVPYYNQPSQEGLYRHFRVVAESTVLPLVVYNIPGRTAANMKPETLARLRRDCPNVIGVKEANADFKQVSDVLELCGRDFNVYSGIEALCFPMLALGGSGHVAATANIAPKEVAALYDYCQEGRWQDARDLHFKLLPLSRALFLETNPGPLKTAMGMMGTIEPRLRLPLCEPGESTQQTLRQVLADLGVLSGEGARA